MADEGEGRRKKRKRGMGGMGRSVRESFSMKTLLQTYLHGIFKYQQRGRNTYSSICLFESLRPIPHSLSHTSF